MKHVIIALLFFPLSVFAQEKALSKENLRGTYQIEFLKTATNPIAVSAQLMEKIETVRKETEVSYVAVNEHCRIKVFPKNALSDFNVKELEESVIVEKFDN